VQTERTVTRVPRTGQENGRLVRQAYVRSPASRPAPGRCPQVSVIIPMYNYGHYLPATVASALAQDGVDVQVIIVDDGSTDDSAQVAGRLADADERVSLIALPANGGPAAAFNRGHGAATGEFIVRLDADDLLTPGSLARSVALFDAFPDVGLVYGHPLHFRGAVPATAKSVVLAWTVWAGPDWVAERCRRAVNCITTPEAIVRASVLAETGLLSTDIKVATDIHMWLRIAAVSDVGHLDGPDQALYRLHDDSLTHRASYTPWVDLLERKSVFDDFFAGPGTGLRDAARLQRTANAALADEALVHACRAYDRGRTGPVEVDQAIAFALATCPEASTLPHWRALLRRQLLGGRLAAMPPFFTGTQIGRRLQAKAHYRRWRQTGV
jgi:Glycosyl transferase family 2